MHISNEFKVKSSQIDPIDVSRKDLYSQDRWSGLFAELRQKAPIQWVPDSPFGPYWSVSTYKPIQYTEALPELFSSSWTYGGISIAFNADALVPHEVRQPMFIAMDPPQHAAQRRTVAPSFGPSQVGDMKAEVIQRTGALIDSLPIGENFDWVQKVSIELTTGMLAKLFDFPWAERHKLTEWSDIGGDVELTRSEDGMIIRNTKLQEMGGRFAELWQEKAQNPGTDLISVMIKSSAMQDMSPEEFIGNLVLLIVGGNDTTRNSMTAFAYGLSQYPEERAKLEADPLLIPNAVQEIIRWQTPLAHMRRTVQQDTDMFGPMMKKGDKVVLWYLSANRDETIFEDGEAIKVDRDNARRHLSFGYGIHRCVGARVAELQLHTLLEELANRRLRVNVVGEPDRVASCFVHGYKSLQVNLSHY